MDGLSHTGRTEVEQSATEPGPALCVRGGSVCVQRVVEASHTHTQTREAAMITLRQAFAVNGGMSAVTSQERSSIQAAAAIGRVRSSNGFQYHKGSSPRLSLAGRTSLLAEVRGTSGKKAELRGIEETTLFAANVAIIVIAPENRLLSQPIGVSRC